MFLVIASIFILIIAGLLFYNVNNQHKTLEDARNSYHYYLGELKKNPSNADLRQQTLAADRTYSNLTRNRGGVTTYDELALMNDINAATAAASHAPSYAPAAPVMPAPSVEDRLKQLDGLRNKSLISDSEYETRRQKILDDM